MSPETIRAMDPQGLNAMGEELIRLRELNAALLEALVAVVAVADRETKEFDAARAAIAAATAEQTEETT